MNEFEWLACLMNIGSRKQKEVVNKIVSDSIKNLLMINNQELLDKADKIADLKKINSNQMQVLANAIYQHKNNYIYDYERVNGKLKLLNCDDAETSILIDKFMDYIISCEKNYE